MPRHAFGFHRDVRQAVRRHVEKAIESVDHRRYRQEAAYTAALAHALEGVAYSGSHGRVEFQSTVMDDRGPGAAERWSGADLAITATITDGQSTVDKAILVQAKRGELKKLSPKEKSRAQCQIGDMKKLTKAPKLMEIPGDDGRPTPGVYSGNEYHSAGSPRRYELGDYFVNRVLTTLDGDTRPLFVEAVKDSTLTQLRVIAKKDE